VVSVAPAVIIVPVPVMSVRRSWWQRTSTGPSPTERKSNGPWPLQQPIPTDETRRLLDDARRTLAERRAQRLWREIQP
jgi:hypothetical protein